MARDAAAAPRRLEPECLARPVVVPAACGEGEREGERERGREGDRERERERVGPACRWPGGRCRRRHGGNSDRTMDITGKSVAGVSAGVEQEVGRYRKAR
jgi:hypothetical protein